MLIGGLEFEDERLKNEEWPARKPTTPLGSLPVATIDGTEYGQSMALLRYFGKLTGLYPDDALKALQVDQVVETVVAMDVALTSSFGDDKDAKKQAQEKAINVDAEKYWGGCQKLLEGLSDGPFVLGEQPSVADVIIATIYLFLKTGRLEFIAHDALHHYPRMLKVFEAVMAVPEVRAYYEKHPVPNLTL